MTCTNDCLTDAKVQQANTKNSTENLSLIKKTTTLVCVLLCSTTAQLWKIKIILLLVAFTSNPVLTLPGSKGDLQPLASDPPGGLTQIGQKRGCMCCLAIYQ